MTSTQLAMCDTYEARIRELEEAIELMLCEIEGIEVGFENGCKGAALMVAKKALGIDDKEATDGR